MTKDLYIWISIDTEINPVNAQILKCPGICMLLVLQRPCCAFSLQSAPSNEHKRQLATYIRRIVLPTELHLTFLPIIALMTRKLSLFSLRNFPRIV